MLLRRWLAWGLLTIIVGLMVFDSSALAGRRSARRIPRPVPVQESEPSAPAATVAVRPPMPTIDPRQAMADILSLRQAQGSGDAVADEAFADALQKLVAEKHGTTVAPLIEASPRNRIEPLVDTAATQAVETLRAAARHFDRRADELESEKQYEAADSARQTAAELRGEARRLDP